MNETFLLVIIFIAFLIWLFILKPKAEESRIEWERQQTKALARQEKHQEEGRIERERQQAKARIERERLNAEARSKQERQKAAAKKREKKSIEDKFKGTPPRLAEPQITTASVEGDQFSSETRIHHPHKVRKLNLIRF